MDYIEEYWTIHLTILDTINQYINVLKPSKVIAIGNFLRLTYNLFDLTCDMYNIGYYHVA